MQRKPLKRHPALVELSKDHHQGLLLCWKIRAGFKKRVEVERIKNYVQHFFANYLIPHFKIEEEQVFPFLPAANLLRQEAETQHTELYDLANKVSESAVDSTIFLSDLEEKLEKHIRFEERQLFMHLQDVLNEEQLDELREKVAAEHQEIKDLWIDPFWV